ncbi:ABC transporter substrate-binding protein [Paenibacillus beijingensis]|uniref:Peptide ABC transporter substrate-binding protein n=1 Tax=Paenibacillus beijingensis TaxID=1126833 RepID=A0A0D5NR23_9BACL|nr:ABC transporter substrate-binding protein [Paenibacillus beijingensis]AJY77769.1 peptide ABC transporter substrate-binding protein [Paenibacillus beijingensis]
MIAGCSSSNSGGGNTNESTNTSTGTTNTSTTTEPPAAAANEPVDGGTLTVSTFSDIVNVNPIFVQDTASGDAGYFLYSNIYDFDRQGNVAVEPWSLAAELPQISADGKEYVVKLKNTAKWSDGQPVTAQDVKFTFDTIKNPDAGAPGISLVDKVAQIDVVDDYTVKFTMKQVYAPFLNVLVAAVVPAHILKDVPVKELVSNPYGTDPAKTVTNGPWKWSEWKQKQYISFDADPNYWGEKKPHISKIIYKIYADQNTEVQALMKGDVDLTQAIPVTQVEAVKNKGGINVILQPGPQYEYLGFNFKADNFPDKFVPFTGQKTRQAIAYAINRQGMVDNVLKGTGKLMNAPFLPGSWADPADSVVNYDYNVEQAKKLLAEDGWVAGEDGILAKDGHRFSFELQYNSGNSRREQVSAIIQQNLKDVGIEVKPKAIDFSSWVEQNLTPGKYEAILLAWSLNNPDPDGESTFSSKYFPPNGQNQGFYKNEKLDQLWVDGYSTVDQEARKKVYAEVGKEISTDLPYVFLYQYGLPEGIGSRVNYAEEDAPEPTLPYGYFFHIINWWVK